MSSVPLDIERDILSRIPIKSLARFRLVSKNWQNTIDDILSEQSSLGTNTRILRWPFWNNEIVQLIDYELLIKSHEAGHATTHIQVSEKFKEWDSTEWWSLRPIGSCNGLICLVLTRRRYSVNDIILWNPLSRVYNKIASFDISPHMDYHVYFGDDVSSGDYKVVVLVEFCTPFQHRRLRVYSVKNDIWSCHELPDRNNCHFYLLETTNHPFLNGSLHWIIRKNFDKVEAERPHYATAILAFDLAEEKFGEIQLPDSLAKVNGSLYCFPYVFLEILDGQLCLLNYRDDDRIDNNDVELWVMKEYGDEKSWVRWFSLADVPSFRPLCMSQEKKIVALVSGKKLVTYDPIQRKLRKIKPRDGEGADVIVYGESLISPNVLGNSSS